MLCSCCFSQRPKNNKVPKNNKKVTQSNTVLTYSPREEHHVQHVQPVLPLCHFQVQLPKHPAAVAPVFNHQARVALWVVVVGGGW